MWPMFYVGLFLALAAPAILSYGHRDMAAAENPRATLAASMLQHHQAATTYAHANPAFAGVIPTPSLAFPAWYQPSGYWTAQISATGTVVTFSNATLPAQLHGAVVDGLITISQASAGAGRSAGGYVQSAIGSVMPLPAGIPLGVPVVATKVR